MAVETIRPAAWPARRRTGYRSELGEKMRTQSPRERPVRGEERPAAKRSESRIRER